MMDAAVNRSWDSFRVCIVVPMGRSSQHLDTERGGSTMEFSRCSIIHTCTFPSQSNLRGGKRLIVRLSRQLHRSERHCCKLPAASRPPTCSHNFPPVGAAFCRDIVQPHWRLQVGCTGTSPEIEGHSLDKHISHHLLLLSPKNLKCP